MYAQYDSLTDQEIQDKTNEFKQRIQDGASLDSLLPEAFAVVKQACKRLVGTTCKVKGQELTWNMVPYDVQFIGGIILLPIAEHIPTNNNTIIIANIILRLCTLLLPL